MKTRITKTLQGEVYFDFMASNYARDPFLANVVLIDVWILLVDCPAARLPGERLKITELFNHLKREQTPGSG